MINFFEMTKNKLSKHKRGSLKTNFRIYLLVFFVFAAVGAVIFRLYTLQVLAHEYYTELASDQHKIFEDLVPKRGEIFMKDGDGYYPVAVNKELNLIFAVPREVENPAEAARAIAPILELDEKELAEKLDNPGGWYAVLAHKVDEEKAQAIREKKIPGIHLSPESDRFYPAGNFASQLVGFVGSDGDKEKGRYGLESFWNKELEGEEGRLEQERDTGGRWISIGEKVMSPAKNGSDLYLTIDHTIQYKAEVAIKKALEKYQADSGSIVILEPNTGAVLAMASTPDFNPNDFENVEDMALFANPVVNSAYEGG